MLKQWVSGSIEIESPSERAGVESSEVRLKEEG